MVFGAKTKWILFLALGWLSHAAALLAVWHGTSRIFGWSSPAKSITIIFFAALIWLILSAFLGSIGPHRNCNFLLSPYRTFGRYKWIYHSKMGFFLMRIGDEKVCVIDVGSFSVTEEFDFINTGNVREMSKTIREFLDRTYERKLASCADANIKSQRIKALVEWDGYLDQDESRDNKLSRILGRKRI